MGVFTGTAGADTLNGGAEADTLRGEAGNDRLFGQEGADLLIGGPGDDLMDGGAVAPVSGAQWDPLTGPAWTDPFTGSNAISYEGAAQGVAVSLALTGAQDMGEGLDTLLNAQQLWGSSFADRLTGDDLRNRLYGYAGDDTLSGLGGDDILAAQGGADLVVGGDGNDWLTGGYVTDPRMAGAGDNTLMGGAGNDTLIGADGADLLEGGDGNDNLRDLGGHFISESGYDIGWVSVGNRLRGGAGDDRIEASIFDAEVDGGDGNDFIHIGRPYYDQWDDPQVLLTVTAGAGNDRIEVGGFNETDRIVIDGGAGENSLWLRDWRIPDIWLNQDHAGPGVVALGFRTVDFDQTTARLHGGDAAEVFNGNYWADWIEAGGGDDLVVADIPDWTVGGRPWGGADSVWGGDGNDTLAGLADQDFLRGDAGNDSLSGGEAFDDLHGNMGDDTVSGGEGGDWVVGGKDQDRLSGEAGGDVVLGNLGHDTADGGAGNDIVRGGQGDDVVVGGDGDDWLSGDLGTDILTGGAGADVFHAWQVSGADRVTDFNAAEGDRVYLLQGTVYTVVQSGADAVLDFGGGHQLTLTGVQSTSLSAGWIFGA